MSILFITHDLGVIAQLCDRVAIMHAGHVVEMGPVRQIFAEPLHPYTCGLLKALPRLERTEALATIPGMPPNLIAPPQGCRFIERCPYAEQRCQQRPPIVAFDERAVMCVRYTNNRSVGA